MSKQELRALRTQLAKAYDIAYEQVSPDDLWELNDSFEGVDTMLKDMIEEA